MREGRQTLPPRSNQAMRLQANFLLENAAGFAAHRALTRQDRAWREREHLSEAEGQNSVALLGEAEALTCPGFLSRETPVASR